jgi:anti-anti-sigma factor
MKLQVATENGFNIVTVAGRIDTTNSIEFEKPLLEMIDSGCKKIILDCAGLNYISSSGLRVFLVIQKRMNSEQGKFRLSNLQPGIREIFDISGFSAIFDVYPDVNTGIHS